MGKRGGGNRPSVRKRLIRTTTTKGSDRGGGRHGKGGVKKKKNAGHITGSLLERGASFHTYRHHAERGGHKGVEGNDLQNINDPSIAPEEAGLGWGYNTLKKWGAQEHLTGREGPGY